MWISNEGEGISYTPEHSKNMLIRSENEANYESVGTDEKPPVYDHTQAVFVRDEKSAAVPQNELGILGMESSKSPNEPEITDRDDLRDEMMFLGFVHITTFFLSLFSGFYIYAGAILVRAIVHFTGFTVLYLEKRILLNFFLVLYAMYLVANTVINGFEVRDMWSPSFCREMASSVKGFNFQQCQNSIGFDRVIKIFVMIGMFLFEASYLHTIQKIIEHDEMIQNSKKQTNSKTTSTILA